MRTLLAILLLATTPAAFAEAANLLPSSSQMMRAARFTPPRAYHIGLTDGALYTGILAYRTMDYLSTQPCLHSTYCQEKELPHFVVATKPGFIAFEAATAVSEIAGSYWMHRHGHGKLARAADLFSVASGSWGVIHNYGVRSHP